MARYCDLRKELTYGQWDAVGTSIGIRMLSESLKLHPGVEYHRTVEGGRLLQTKQLSKRWVDGGIDLYPVYDQGLGELLHACLGDVATSQPDAVNAPNTYLHEFTPKTSIKTTPWPSYSVEIGLDDVAAKRVLGAVVESLAFDVEAGDFLGVTAEIYAADEQKVTLGSGASLSTQDYIHSGDVVTQTIGGTGVKLEHFSLEISNNFPEGFQFGAKTPQQIDIGPLEVTGEMAIRFLADTHLDDFLASTERAVALKFQGPLIEGTYYHYLQIDLPRVVYDAGDANLNEQERLVQNLEFTAIQEAGGNIVKISLENTKTGY